MKSIIDIVKCSFIKFFLLLTCFYICKISLSKAQEFQFSGNRNSQGINFSLIRNLVIIPVYLNEKGPFNFILDTGVGPMVLTDTSLISLLMLKELRTIKISGMGKGAEISAYVAPGISAKVGNAHIKEIPTVMLKDDIFKLSNYLGIRIHGLLGYYFFKSFVVKINYSNKRLGFYTHQVRKRILGEKVPIELINNKPYIKINISNKEFGEVKAKVVVDNGASHSLSLETLHNDPFPLPELTIPANLGIGLSGPISGSVGRISTLKIGTASFKNVITSYPAYDEVAVKTVYLNRNGNLGAEILSRFNVTFDYAGTAMYLNPNRHFNRPFEHDMSGMEVYTEETGIKRFFISRIEPGSPAEISGVQIDDEIISINSQMASELDLGSIIKTLKARTGGYVFLILSRKGKFLFKRMLLKKRI
ncbi:aspartyl protease family protein [Pedobacter metabolipauper]|uniref:PDZ domain-containing protein n=1 Tax=Pedobacter metabolipauper TaxID=425513 RepID=A0A4V6PW12_9SPHI|nr:aspartyl protease family protein [Pedobacter metabolipauper]TDQ09577.1 PDZ domain-containing protein [Pedobacter metabolipauper]